jgi:hypothetical protein
MGALLRWICSPTVKLRHRKHGSTITLESKLISRDETYLRTRWIEGKRNTVGLFREVTAHGYTGSRMTIERFLLGLRRVEQQGIEVSQEATSVELTPRCGTDASFWH